MVLSDYDETGQWAPGVYEEKLAEHNRERAIKDKQEADYKESWSAANWTKAMVAMISLDEGAWTALASGTVDDFLMDSTKTTPEEFALQVSMLAVIVIAGKAGEVGGARSGRASSSRSVTTAEIYEQARAEGIDLPTDNAFELRINELTREFNAQTPAAKRATIQNGLDIRLSEAQTRFDSADTPLLKSQRKMKLDEANTLKNKFLGDFAKSDEGLAKAKGKADDYSGSGMLFETESSGSYTKSKAFKPSELKEMESEGLLARQRSRAAEEVAKAAKARADARKSTSEKIEKQKQDLETFGKKARDTEAEKPPLKTSEIEDGLDDALDPAQENPTPTPEEPIDIFLKNNPQATQTEINNFKAKSPEIQKYINDFRAKYTPEQIAKGLEATRKARETRKAADEAAEYIKNNPEEPSETDPLIEKDEPELKEDPKPINNKVYPEDNPLLDKLEAQGVQLTQLEIDRLKEEFDFDYVNELNPAEPTETTGDPRDLLDYDEQDGELTPEEKKELLDKYGFDFDKEVNPAERTDTGPDPAVEVPADEVERDDPNPVTETEEVDQVIDETGNTERDTKGPTTGKKGPNAAEAAAAAALIIGQAKAGESGGSENQDDPGTQPNDPSTTDELGSATGNEFKIKNTLITRNIDELLEHTLKLSRRVYAGETLGNIESDTADYEGQNDKNYYLDGLTVPVLINIRKGIVYVAFRGTADFPNLITDLRSGMLDFRESTFFKDRINLNPDTDIKVHAGNLKALEEIYDTVREEIDKNYKNSSVVFTGHSLGAAMATLFYFAYVNDTQNPEKKLGVSNCVTWASPRFLQDTELNIRNYNKSCPNVIRVFNEMDIVPYLPFRRCLNDDWVISIMEQIFYYGNLGLQYSPVDICGFVHVGIPLNLDSNIAYNDINNLISLIFDGGSNVIKDLVNKAYSPEDIKQNGLLDLIYSKKWRESLLLGTIKCIPYVPELQPINKFVLGNFILDNVSKLRDFNEKCNVLKPLDLADFMKTVGVDVCGETEYQQNVNLSILASVSAQAASNLAEYHKLNKYEELLEKLIFKQAETKKSILNRSDPEGNIYLKQSDYEEKKKIEEIIRNNQFKLPNIIGIYEGKFDNYDFISY